MRGFSKGSAAALITTTNLFTSVLAASVDPIVIKGNKFFYQNNGTQFYIRGVAYQQDYTGGGTDTAGTGANSDLQDPLADTKGCQRDIPYLQQLQTNTIRVYALDPSKNHDTCMNALADAGIYVIADLSTPTVSINRDTPSWNDELYARYASVIDDMQKYDNMLGFFAGNEVSNAINNTEASSFVKAAVRDMKSYIAKQGYRTIGVGYATNDDPDIRIDLANYFNCGNQDDAIDFWGYNIYSWCGNSSYTESGYNLRTQEFESYSVPAFFAEYGCNKVEPRPFTEVGTLFGPQMEDVWSGGIVYMYFQEANDFGLISLDGNSVKTLQDFSNLKTQMAKIHPTGTQMGSYSPTNSPAACPSLGSDWDAKSSPLPPTPNKQLCSCMTSALGCVVDPSTSSNDYGDLFGYVCKHDTKACDGIAANSSTGTYGAYSMCAPDEQLSFVFNQYYQDQGRKSTACDFKGAAKLQKASSGGSSCKNLVAQAGTAGTGTVTSAPSGKGGAAASSSSGAASVNTIPTYESGLLPIAFITVFAALSGMGMILL